MESGLDHQTALALLEWQLEIGVDETIGEMPVDRFAVQPDPEPRRAEPEPGPAGQRAPLGRAPQPKVDPVEEARKVAGAASDLEQLRAALDAYPHCDLKKGARKLVFSDGQVGAKVMILGEAPGRDEDREGVPFVGRAGHLLDRMLAAIGLDRRAEDRARAVYITNVLPWRPPQNRDPNPTEIAMMVPFVQRHIELAKPDLLVLMGNIACDAALGKRGILRLRGNWAEAFGRPALPMTHPAYLLRQPHAKREAWADLLALRERLNEG